MAGVLFRVYIPTSQHECKMREHLKTKGKLSTNSSEVPSDKESNCVTPVPKDSVESRLSKPKGDGISKSSTRLDEVIEMGAVRDKTSELETSDDGEEQLLKSTTKNETSGYITKPHKKTSRSLEDIPQKHAENTGEINDMPMEKALKKVLKAMNIVTAIWCQGENTNYFQVMFSMDADSDFEETLHQLEEYGIGFRLNSVVSVMPCSLHYQGVEEEGKMVGGRPEGGQEQVDGEKEDNELSEWDAFLASIRARLTVAQVVQGVKAGASLTFDFIALLVVAGFLSALGLVENSTVVLVASMLISPLMGPIMAGTFGTMIADRYLQKIGFRNELLGLLICLIIGFLFGSTIGLSTDQWGDGEWPTEEMTSRGKLRSLWVGVLIALFSGAAVAISTLADYTGSLVGVAISASLLPPAVNAGLLWSLACTDLMKGSDVAQSSTVQPLYSYVYSEHRPSDLAILGTVSMGLTLLNILCIFLAGILVLKVKAVAPRATKEQHDFWKDDVKVAKSYNWTWTGEDARELGRRLARERSGLSPDESEFGNYKRKGRNLLQFSQEKFNPSNISTDGAQLTWSPNTRNLHSPDMQSVQELETLYRTLAETRRNTPPRLLFRQLSESSRRSLGSPSSASPQIKNFGQPVFPAGISLETVPETRAGFKVPTTISMEPPKRPQRFRSARFVVTPTPTQDPLLKL